MIERFRTSILKSHLIFSYMNDTFRIVFLYILLMMSLMILPFILIETTEGVISSQERLDVIRLFKERVMIHEPTFSNGVLSIEEEVSFPYSFFEFRNTKSDNPFGIQIVMFEENIQFLVADSVYDNITYLELISRYGEGLDNTNMDSLRFASLMVSWLNDMSLVKTIYYMALVISVFIEYLFITLIFTVMMRFNKKNEVSFGKHFKIGIYLTSIYASSQLLLMLFQVYSLGFLSFFLTYIIYVRAYRTKGQKHEHI